MKKYVVIAGVNGAGKIAVKNINKYLEEGIMPDVKNETNYM